MCSTDCSRSWNRIRVTGQSITASRSVYIALAAGQDLIRVTGRKITLCSVYIAVLLPLKADYEAARLVSAYLFTHKPMCLERKPDNVHFYPVKKYIYYLIIITTIIIIIIIIITTIIII